MNKKRLKTYNLDSLMNNFKTLTKAFLAKIPNGLSLNQMTVYPCEQHDQTRKRLTKVFGKIFGKF